MTTPRYFLIEDYKSPYATWPVEIDLTTWLDGDTISGVTFIATDPDGTDVTSSVTDEAKTSFTSTKIMPWLKEGTPGKKYLLTMSVTTGADTQEEFYLGWEVEGI